MTFYFSELQVYISQIWIYISKLRKKSELGDKKSQLLKNVIKNVFPFLFYPNGENSLQ